MKKLSIKSKKNIVIIVLLFVFLVLMITVFLISNNLNLMGNSVANYYCEDADYKLINNKCIKEIKEKPFILGDLNYDSVINDVDINVMNEYIDKTFENENYPFTEEQFLVADIDRDGEIFNNDFFTLKAYINGLTEYNTYKSQADGIGTLKMCKQGYELKDDVCLKTISVPAIYNSGQVTSSNDHYINVVYNSNNGLGVMDKQTIKINSKEKLNKNKFTKEGYKFIGWRIYNNDNNKWSCYSNALKTEKNFLSEELCNKNGYVIYNDEEDISSLVNVNQTFTLFAEWSNYFTVKYSAKDANGSMEDQKIVYGVKTKLNKNAFTKNNFVFVGYKAFNVNQKKWACYKDSDKKTQGYDSVDVCEKNGYVIYKDENIVSKTAEPGEEVIMYAQWADKFKVKYNANGGTGLMDDQEFNIDVNQELSSNKFKKNGYAFVGWLAYNNTKKQYACFNEKNKSIYTSNFDLCKKYGYTIYHNNEIISKIAEPGEEVIMYAQWLKISDKMQPTTVEDLNLGYNNLSKFTYTKNIQDIDVDSNGNFYVSQDLNDGYKVHRMIISKVDKNGNKQTSPYLYPFPQLGHGNFEIYNGNLYTACDSNETYKFDEYKNNKKISNYNGANLLCKVNIKKANENNPKEDKKITFNSNNGFDIIYTNSNNKNYYYYNAFDGKLEFIKIDSKDGKTAVVRTSKGDMQYFKIYELDKSGKIKTKKGQFIISYKNHLYNNNKVTMQSFDIYDNKIYLFYGNGSFEETNYNSISYIDVYDFSPAFGYNKDYYNLKSRKSCNKMIDTGKSSNEQFDKKGFFFEAEGIAVRNDYVYLGFASIYNTKHLYGQNKYVSIYKIKRQDLDKGSYGC